MPKDRRRKNQKNKEKNGAGERLEPNSSAGDVEVPYDAADTIVRQDTDVAIDDGQSDGTTNGPVENAEIEESHLFDTTEKLDSSPTNIEESMVPHDVSEQLVRNFVELTFQNEFFKAQFDVLRDYSLTSVENCKFVDQKRDGENQLTNVEELQEKIKSLTKELQEQKEMQIASDNALKHLQTAYSDADSKSQELSAKLTEAQQKMDSEIKQRDEKYVELDSKFGRLLKRAKQRIQELQKEKDDLEIRFREVNEVAEKASSQQATMQQELERTRQNANEALRSMDVDRQQLRTANNKLRESADELRRLLEAKESALEGLQQSLFEKEQALEDMQTTLEAANEKKEASISEISAKHQKQIQSLEGQLADALLDRSKAADTISSLQTVIAEKESEIAELEAASSGEAVRLRAVIEATKGEINQLKQEHEKERASWNASYEALKSKLEMAENTCLRSEIEAAKSRSQLELELSVQNQLLNSRDADLAVAKEEINRLEREFSSYKVRAHALLQKKNEELDEANIKAKEEAIKEAQRELAMAAAERDKAIQDLQDALSSHDEELAMRDAALTDAEQRIRRVELKLESANTRYLSEKEEWQRSSEKVEETWRLKYETLEAQKNEQNSKDVEVELEELILQHKRLQEEHKSFRDLADRMMEDKDNEISKLLEENKNLLQSLASRPPVGHIGNQNSTLLKQDNQASSGEAAEQQILLLARQQAQREDELAQSQRHILALQEEIEELERENRLHNQQEAMLKAELRNMERNQKREGIDMTYLKNVILKLLETGEVEALLPVIGMLLQFSPEEIKKCQQAYSTASEGQTPADGTSVPRSLFSRFTFT